MSYKIVSIVGARPQFIKLAPIYRAFMSYKDIRHIVLHTGQHYDFLMSDVFFKVFSLPDPDINLNIGSGSQHLQTGEMIKGIGEALLKISPDMVIIYGDTNSTLAGAVASAKLGIPIAHIEAGLRSFRRGMQEEINRVVADRLSDILFVPSRNAISNLKNEGIKNIVKDLADLKKVKAPYVVECGDLMYDILKAVSKSVKEKEPEVLDKYNIKKKGYALATIHRAENTDNIDNLKNIFSALDRIGDEIEVILPIHPRTKEVMRTNGLDGIFKNIHIIEPLPYDEMLVLQKNSRFILTDSGGVQKEAFWLSVPCITLRDETEWVETVRLGYNILAGTKYESIVKAFNRVMSRKDLPKKNPNVYGDGKAAERIARFIHKALMIIRHR
jgi:UDP-N-acetylglucosamine 2-epimerase